MKANVKRHPALQFLLFIVTMLSIIVPVVAQTSTGTLTGVVTDPTKAAVPGAVVRAVNIATNVASETVTRAEGNYSIPSLPPGQYRLEVEKNGFSKAVIASVDIFATQITTSDVTLAIGETSDTVTITSETPLLTRDSAQVTTTIENKLLLDLPFSERSALGAVFLTAGVQGDAINPVSAGSENPGVFASLVAPAASITIGGARPGTGSILVDGSDNVLPSFPRSGVTFSGDTVREISVQVTGIPAQYGRTGGGVINQATKGGGNQYHGSLYWQHIDPGLIAWGHGSHQRGEPPQLRQNMYSGTIGGPIWLPKKVFGPANYNGRNRSFFFFSYEPLRIANEVFFTTGRIPTARELTGDLRESYDVLTQCAPCVTALRTQGVEAALAVLRAQYAAGTAPQLYYQFDRNAQGMPYGIRYTNRNQYVPIPGNDLRGALANNPIAQRILAIYPTPQNPSPWVRFIRPDGLWDQTGANFYRYNNIRNKDTRYSMRFDHALTRNDRLAFRYTFVPVRSLRFTFFGPESPASAVPSDRSLAQNFFFSHTRNFGSSKVNEFRATYTRADQARDPSEYALAKDWGAELGLRPATLGKGFPTIDSLTLRAGSGSGGGVGLGGAGNAVGITVDVNLGISDDFSWITGRHALKFGVDYRAYQMNRYDTTGQYGGSYIFNPGETGTGVGGGSGLASFILGIVSSHQVKTVQVPFYYRWKYYAGYAQDDFKVRPNLTINYGLRYSVETPRTEKYNRQGSFDPDVTGALNGVPVKGGFVFAGEQGRPRTLWKTNYMGFEPRLGIAWTPLDRMTVRTSFALLRAPLTGLSYFILPDLNVPSTALGGNNGGVNPGYINLVTNPVGPIPPNVPLSNGPLFDFGGLYVDPSNAVPYAQQWALALQYQVSRDLVFEVTYNGNKGTHLFSGSTDFNRPSYDAIREAIKNRVNLNTTTENAFGIKDASGRLLRVSALQALRPYQHFFNNPIQSVFDRRGNAMYHALYVQARQRLSKGLLVQGSFSWSKSIDDASSAFGGATTLPTDIFGLARPQDPTNLRPERAVSTYDIPWKLTYGFNYDLPFGRGRLIRTGNKALNAVIGDWSLSGIGAYQGGYPLWLRLGNQGYWFSAGGGDNVLPGATIRPNIIPGQPLINPDWRKDPYTISYVNLAALGVPGSLDNPDFGTSSRTLSTLRNPNSFILDTSLRKGIKLRSDGKASLILRGDFINVLNHPNFFFNPNNGHDLLTGNFNRNSLTDPALAPFTINPAFGKFGSSNTTPARTIRVAVKLIW